MKSSMAQSRHPLNPLLSEPSASVDCPSDDDLLAFALGKLPSVRIPEIETHLDGCVTCQRVLFEAAHALATAVTSPLPEARGEDWNTTFQRGTLVDGRYAIQRFITRGGMGEVYEAFDHDLAQRVALKTVTSTAGDNTRAVKRLKGEVQLARRVSHPNVCRIYDFGTHALPGKSGEVHFLTMEFVDGETLGQRVRLTGALPFAEAQKVTRDLLLGLRAAHAADVLHRDFKSDNVMLKTGSDGESHAVVLDFGLARGQRRDEAKSASHSNLVGTFGYIAPEQLEGKPHTEASDVYAFGVVWFELLTGQMPFETGSLSSPRVVKGAHDTPPAPSQLNAELPRELDALVLRCLERSPSKRFQSVDEVLAALDALDAPRRRSRPLWIGAALFGLLTLSAGVWTARPFEKAEAAVLPVVPAEAPPAKPVGMLDHAPVAAPVAAPVVTPAADRVITAPSTTKPAAPRASAGRASTARSVKARSAPTSNAAQSEAASRPAEPAPPALAAPVPTPPAPNPPPASPAPPRPKKPDWENPFGSVHPTELAATAT